MLIYSLSIFEYESYLLYDKSLLFELIVDSDSDNSFSLSLCLLLLLLKINSEIASELYSSLFLVEVNSE